VKKILFVLMACVLCIGLVGGAFAYFTDTETSSTNSFTAGTLELDGTGITGASAITIDCMAPGDVTGEYVITIKNAGCLDLIWFGDWQFTGGGGSPDLMEALYIDYAKMEFLDDTGTPGVWEPTDNFITDGIGSGPSPDWFNTLAGTNTFGVVGFDVWDDNNGMGTTPYEHVGALTPGYAYRLTVKFGFAPGADSTYEGLGPITAKLVVDAIQLNQDQLTAKGYPGLWSWLNTQIAKQ